MESEQMSEQQEKKPWHASIAEVLQRTTDSAIRSARSLQHNSSAHLRSLQVASRLSLLKQQRVAVEKRILKISN